MPTAYFSDSKLAGLPGWPAAWADSLARQQEIYEELLASQEREQPTSAARRRPLSRREITQNLVGWSPPGAGALGAR
ncbi:MAG: hypothetical protein ACRYFZ_05350 [Janthinobacterium lividum]